MWFDGFVSLGKLRMLLCVQASLQSKFYPNGYVCTISLCCRKCWILS